MTPHNGLARHPAARVQSLSSTPLQGLAAWLLNLSNRAWVKARRSGPLPWPTRGSHGGRHQVKRPILVLSPTDQVRAIAAGQRYTSGIDSHQLADARRTGSTAASVSAR